MASASTPRMPTDHRQYADVTRLPAAASVDEDVYSAISKEDMHHLKRFATPTTPCPSESSSYGLTIAKHSRSKSAPENTFELLSKDMTPQDTQGSNLRKRLKVDRHVSRNIEKEKEVHSPALMQQGRRHTMVSEANDIVEEIGFLEGEIAELEQYVLTLYRSMFDNFVGRPPSIICSHSRSGVLDKRKELKSPRQPHIPKHSPKARVEIHDNSYVATSNSSSSNIGCTVHAKARHAPMLCESLDVARDCQVPLSQSPHQAKAASQLTTVRSILQDEDSGPRPLKDYLSESANHLSEDLVRCMASIYCKLSSSPPVPSMGAPESPLSSSSSLTSFSSIHGMFSDGWSPGSRTEQWYADAPLVDPFQVKGNAGWRGAYSDMVEVPHICTDKDKLNSATRMLRGFRSVVEKLERVDPSKLKHKEKLAFWINIYNALLMHAYLAYGIPRNDLKRMSLLQKASYKVGGHVINAHTIGHYILRCNFHRPTQWLQNLLSSGFKVKSTTDARRLYAIDRAEPLVCFALCCGARSDPAVRVYTAKHVYEELELSMKEYLQASAGFQTSRKVILPKVLEWYMKEASLSYGNLLDWVAQYANEQERENIRRCIHSKPHKSVTHCIEWVPYNFGFRYILHRDLTLRTASSTH